ncbi:MAG: hydrogenase expression/formation protein HypE [Phycisphaerales bacterium]|nr:hydrogenase expression/formation protein HypE [Phycisphaerales bacterium]
MHTLLDKTIPPQKKHSPFTIPNSQFPRVLLAHGGGGQLTDSLLNNHILPHISNPILNDLLDSGILPTTTNRLAISIDSYVVTPWKFPGGDIGRLAVSGTINDLAVTGATPLALALSIILAEGFELTHLDAVMASIATTAKEANVRIITGDTKVVAHNQADGIYLTTAGLGSIPHSTNLHPSQITTGQLLLLNGPIADHGLAVMLAREFPDVTTTLQSDVAPLNHLIHTLMTEHPNAITFMRDPTRGGLAGLCADLARQTRLHITLDESAIPIRHEARHAADMLGLDPLEIANEGKILLTVHPQHAQQVLQTLRSHPLGRDSAIIGQIDKAEHTPDAICELRTLIGGRRIIHKPYGEQLPRIC